MRRVPDPAGQVTVLVDAANVVGSRPDGWWRDRAGAARRLLDRLRPLAGARLPASGPAAGSTVGVVAVVLEGQARAGVPAGAVGPVVVHHAPASGDEVLAALSGPGTVLVTADRALARRAQARGAQVAGPRWLLDQLAPRSAGRARPVDVDAAHGQQDGQQAAADDRAVRGVEAGPDQEVEEVDDRAPPEPG